MNEHPLEQLSLLIDRLLPEGEKKAVEKHLEGCSKCREELAQLKAAAQAVAALPKHELPRGFMARLEAKRNVVPAPRLPLQAFAFAAASALVMLVAYRGLRDKPARWGALSQVQSAADTSANRLERDGRASRFAAAPPASMPLAQLKQDAAAKDLDAKGQASNEELYSKLEDEKKKMGIRRIITSGEAPEAPQRRLDEAGLRKELQAAQESRREMRMMSDDIAKTLEARRAPSVPISGNKPALLGKPPASPAARQFGRDSEMWDVGAVIDGPEALGSLQKRFPDLPLPKVDFSEQSIVVVFPQEGFSAEIARIEETQEAFIVHIRRKPASEAAGATRAMRRPEKPVQFLLEK